MRLPIETPVRQALNICFEYHTNKQCRPTNTWIRTIKEDLKKGNINLDLKNPASVIILENLASDRKGWNVLKKLLMQ